MEYGFIPNSATVSNLSALSDKNFTNYRRRVCELYELAEDAADFTLSLIKEDFGIYEALSLIADACFTLDAKPDATDPIFSSFCLFSFSCLDKAEFSLLYTEALRKRGVSLSESQLLDCQNENDETFVYVKNAFADEAYDVFSQEFTDPRVRYAPNFREALRLVSSGEVTYCLLPFEEQGMRLASVSEFMLVGDYKISAVTPVFGADGGADIKYALVSKKLRSQELRKDDDRYFEIRISATGASALSDISSAATVCGAEVYKVNTLTLTNDGEKKKYFSMVFSGEGVDFTPLIVFLTMFVPDYVAVGAYKNIEN